MSDFEEEGGLLTETKLERVGYCETSGTTDSDNDEDQLDREFNDQNWKDSKILVTWGRYQNVITITTITIAYR